MGVWQRYGDYRLGRTLTRQDPGSHTLYQSVQTAVRNEVAIAGKRWRRQPDVAHLKPLIEKAKREAEEAEKSGKLSGAVAWAWLRALVLQAPQAALAQVQMDRHPHGYKSRGERLYELIDFNDAFVATVLALPESELDRFEVELKRLLDWFCKRLGVRSFSEEQYSAIVHGLEREIAVYRGVQAEGLQVVMTSRASDAMGIDMVITDPASSKHINIDCKAPSAYRHRIYDLLRDGRLRPEEVTAAETLGYIGEINGHKGKKVKVILWRIDTERYGEIRSFGFADTHELGRVARTILETYGD